MAVDSSKVEVKDLSPATILSIRKQTKAKQAGQITAAAFMQMLEYLSKEIQKMSMVQGRPFTITHSSDGDAVDIEMCVPLSGDVPVRGDMKLRQEGAIKVASLLVQGPYSLLDDATEAVKKWIATNGFTASGPVRQVFVVGPLETTIANDYKTDIQIPV